ncbi:Amyloid protein-binding protein 2 [Halocaridina rubra]|uniref:Amyloid protein-binding protein 2 n=1 Tax=Halocaridina rubra TaxID=373956 RepID=A0AAN9AGG6_HALRR
MADIESKRNNNESWSVMSENHLSEKFPLHRACRDGDVSSLKLFLHQEAARSHIVLEDTYYGWTPTHWAAYFGKVRCCICSYCARNRVFGSLQFLSYVMT